MRINPRMFYIVILVLTGLVLGLHAVVKLSWRSHTSARITVFVHGSLFTGLSLLNPGSVLDDMLTEDSWYVSMLKNIRKNNMLWEDQILLEQGWQEIAPEVLRRFDIAHFDDDHKKIGAHFIVPAYDAYARNENNQTDHFYYAFGHLGLLSQRYRREVADELYESLCTTIAKKKQHYDHVKVVIVAHSHGGNIALNLADSEDQRKQELMVDDLIMFGAPLQVETASYAYSPVFKRVINLYSDGDYVQTADTFSTRARRSYQTFSSPGLGIPPAGTHDVYDIRLLINKKTWPIDHVNMWFMGKSKKTCSVLYPLPIMIFTPALLQMLDAQTGHKALDCNIVEHNNALYLELRPHKQDAVLKTSANVYDKAEQLVATVKDHWDPEDKSRAVVLNKKTFSLIYDAWNTVRSDKGQTSEASSAKAPQG